MIANRDTRDLCKFSQPQWRYDIYSASPKEEYPQHSINDSDDNFMDEPRDIVGREATRQNSMMQPSRPFLAKHGRESRVVLDALSDREPRR